MSERKLAPPGEGKTGTNGTSGSYISHMTAFFRNRSHFEALERDVIPEIVRAMPGDARHADRSAVRVLSAGCSSGEEPYSIAMLLKELLPDGYTMEIVATDVDRRSLAVAERGYYRATQIARIPRRFVRRYLRGSGKGFSIAGEIRRLVRFVEHDLATGPVGSDFDLVFCRNVLTYIDEESRGEIIDTIWKSMSERSYLVLGGSESLLDIGAPANARFELVATGRSVFYLKRPDTPYPAVSSGQRISPAYEYARVSCS